MGNNEIMKASEFINLFDKAKKRLHWMGDLQCGVGIALDMEGRIFTSLHNEMLNRVNPEAIAGQSSRNLYLNPGGDVLWPAPEGTSMGYNYSSGSWRVTPGLIAARYQVIETTERKAIVEAEIDLVNAAGQGIPAVFKREIEYIPAENSITLKIRESIRYIGARNLNAGEFLIAPWSLCQFDCHSGSEVRFPYTDPQQVWDLYEDTIGECGLQHGNFYRAIANGSRRYQIGISAEVPWIELTIPDRQLLVLRTADYLGENLRYIDISDVAPSRHPGSRGIRYSVYSDTSNFMEIEASGGCPEFLAPDTETGLIIETKYFKI